MDILKLCNYPEGNKHRIREKALKKDCLGEAFLGEAMSWVLEAEEVPVMQQAECPGRGSKRERAHFEEVKECCVSWGSEPWEGLEENLGDRGDRCFWNSMTMHRLLRARRDSSWTKGHMVMCFGSDGPQFLLIAVPSS